MQKRIAMKYNPRVVNEGTIYAHKVGVDFDLINNFNENDIALLISPFDIARLATYYTTANPESLNTQGNSSWYSRLANKTVLYINSAVNTTALTGTINCNFGFKIVFGEDATFNSTTNSEELTIENAMVYNYSSFRQGNISFTQFRNIKFKNCILVNCELGDPSEETGTYTGYWSKINFDEVHFTNCIFNKFLKTLGKSPVFTGPIGNQVQTSYSNFITIFKNCLFENADFNAGPGTSTVMFDNSTIEFCTFINCDTVDALFMRLWRTYNKQPDPTEDSAEDLKNSRQACYVRYNLFQNCRFGDETENQNSIFQSFPVSSVQFGLEQGARSFDIYFTDNMFSTLPTTLPENRRGLRQMTYLRFFTPERFENYEGESDIFAENNIEGAVNFVPNSRGVLVEPERVGVPAFYLFNKTNIPSSVNGTRFHGCYDQKIEDEYQWSLITLPTPENISVRLNARTTSFQTAGLDILSRASDTTVSYTFSWSRSLSNAERQKIASMLDSEILEIRIIVTDKNNEEQEIRGFLQPRGDLSNVLGFTDIPKVGTSFTIQAEKKIDFELNL